MLQLKAIRQYCIRMVSVKISGTNQFLTFKKQISVRDLLQGKQFSIESTCSKFGKISKRYFRYESGLRPLSLAVSMIDRI